MNWYISVLKKYVVFTGRAQRAEYWYFILFNLIITVVLSGIDAALGESGILSGIYGLAVLLPGLGVSVRRLHDTSRTGWWLLIGLIPLVGFIVLIIFMAQDSTPGANAHGPNPKGVGA